MSLPTLDSARDEVLGLFRTAWNTYSPAYNYPTPGTPVLVTWPGVDSKNPPPAGSPWARVTVRHGPSRQTTFGPTGSRRFTRTGFVQVQVFAPLSEGVGLSRAEQLAIIARNAFEGRGTASGIWFRTMRVQELGVHEAWYQVNVVAEFEYDEMR